MAGDKFSALLRTGSAQHHTIYREAIEADFEP